MERYTVKKSYFVTILLLLISCEQKDYGTIELVNIEVSNVRTSLKDYGYYWWDIKVTNYNAERAKEVWLYSTIYLDGTKWKCDTLDFDWIGSGITDKKEIWTKKMNTILEPNRLHLAVSLDTNKIKL